MADNVRAYLSLTRYVQRDDLTDGQVRRLADRAVDEAADALRPFGYYDPQVRSRTTRDDATLDRAAAHQAGRAGADARGGRLDHRPGKRRTRRSAWS